MDALRTEIPPVRINLKTFGKWFRSLAKIQNGFSVYFTGQQTQVPLSRQKKVAIKLYCQNVFSFWCDYKRWCGRHEELCEFMINGFRNELFNIRPLIINQTRRRDTWKQIGDMPEYTSDFHLDAQSWNAFFKKVQPVLSFDPEYFKENRINAFVDEAFADNWWERRYAYILSIEMLVRLRVFLFRELYHDAVRAYMFTTGNVQISEETALRQLIRAYLESMSNGKQLDLFHSVSYIGAKPVISKGQQIITPWPFLASSMHAWRKLAVKVLTLAPFKRDLKIKELNWASVLPSSRWSSGACAVQNPLGLINLISLKKMLIFFFGVVSRVSPSQRMPS